MLLLLSLISKVGSPIQPCYNIDAAPLTVGWAGQVATPLFLGTEQGWADGQQTQKCGAGFAAPLGVAAG
jgi:hypothetical protein